jgi:hypothetical protein
MKIRDYEKWMNDDELESIPQKTGKILKKMKRDEKREIQSDGKSGKTKFAKR